MGILNFFFSRTMPFINKSSKILYYFVTSLCTIIFCLWSTNISSAMTDMEYKNFMELSEEFAEAENTLNSVWKQIKDNLPQEQYTTVLQEQRAWNKNRDAEALAAQRDGYSDSLADCYALITEKRVHELEEILLLASNSVSTAQDQLQHKEQNTVELTQRELEPRQESGREEDNFVVVEAEGRGLTRMEALNAAWMEAVRLGVGLFLTSKTEIIDDEITEKIVTHSRGKVDSYRLIDSAQTEDGWDVLIQAQIEKNILEETAKSITKMTVSFDGSNIAAKQVSEEAQKKSAQELIDSFYIDINPEDFINYNFEIVEIDNQFFAYHTFVVDNEKYIYIASEYMKLLDQISISKNEEFFSQETININNSQRKFADNLLSNKEYSFVPNIENKWSDWAKHYILIPDRVIPRYGRTKADILRIDKNMNNYVCVVINNNKFIQYSIDIELMKKIVQIIDRFRYTIQCYVKNNEDTFYNVTDKEIFFLFTPNLVSNYGYVVHQTLAPAFYIDGKANTFSFQVIQKLEFTPEQLTSINELTGSFKITGVE